MLGRFPWGLSGASWGPRRRENATKARNKAKRGPQKGRKRRPETSKNVQKDPKRTPKNCTMGEIGAEDGSKEQFEDRSPKTSKTMTLSSEKYFCKIEGYKI